MKKRKLKKEVKLITIFLVIPAILLLMASVICIYLMSPVDKVATGEVEVVIESGMSTKKIGELLKEKDLIRSEKFFFIYNKINRCPSLKASTYNLRKNMTLDEIIKSICDGNSYNPDVVKITFQEGKRIPDYAKLISEKTNHSYEEVIGLMNNETYLRTLQSKYWFITEEVFKDGVYYPLEGLLSPDTYLFESKDVKIEYIIEKLLDETSKKLHPYKISLENGPYTIGEYITLASILELEGTNDDNRKKIMGVFENRIQAKMNLGSDVTTYYGLQKPLTEDLTSKEIATINSYNTRTNNMIGKLPIGPICSISLSSLKAAVQPDNNDYYYFVADKNGKIYYTKTNREHEEKVMEIKEAGDWIW